MKGCRQCGTSLRKTDTLCPKCGAKNAPAHTLGARRNRTPKQDEVIRVSAADVVVRDYPPLLTEDISPEQLWEEECAYLEDRDPILVQPPTRTPDPITVSDLLTLSGPCMVINQDASRACRLIAALTAITILGCALFANRLTDDPAYLLRYATNAVIAHNYEGAVTTLERLVILDADNPEVYFQLVTAHQSLGEDAKAFAAAQSGYENTLDDRLRTIVTEYTFGAYTPPASGGPTQQPQDAAGDVLPSGLAEDTITALSALYEDARAFDNGLALVRQNGLWGGIDHTGAWVIPPVYDELSGFSDSLCAAKRGGLWGFVDAQGSERIPPQYEAVTPVVEGRAGAKMGGMWVVITSGGAVLSEGVDELLPFSGSLAAARVGAKWGYLNRTGEWAIAPAYDEALPFGGGLAAVKVGAKWGYIDAAGRTVLAPQYHEAYGFTDGVARVKTDESTLFINPMGWQIGDGVWQDARGFRDGLAVVLLDGLYGVINPLGEIVVPCRFSQLGDYSEGLCAFYQNGLWGYLDRAGKVRIPPQFLQADAFTEGVARVTHTSGATSYINAAGQYLCDARFEDGGICSQSRIAVKESGAWGYLAVIVQQP